MQDDFHEARERMVARQIKSRGISDVRVLDAMRKIPRHLFVPENIRAHAYDDEPLPIGEGQTISQPYIVAYMSAALGLVGEEKVLEIGTGSGYQTSVLAELAGDVFSLELIESLSRKARKVIAGLGYRNIQFAVGDGSLGWVSQAPFDAILVTAAPRKVPKSLLRQLGIGGRLVIPVGVSFQDLVLIRRGQRGLQKKRLLPVRFVPLVSPSEPNSPLLPEH